MCLLKGKNFAICNPCTTLNVYIIYVHTVAGFYRRSSIVAAGTIAPTVKCRLDISVYSESSVFMHLARAIEHLEKNHLEILKTQQLLHNNARRNRAFNSNSSLLSRISAVS